MVAAACDGAAADSVADFYRGKTVTMVVGSEAGGGYDIYARLLARHLGRYIPGNPSFVVQNRPGAGSVIATNYIATVAPQDGSIILAPNRTAAFVQLLGQSGARYDATRLNWLGSLNTEIGVLEVARAAPVKTVEHARNTSIIVGSTTVGSDGDVYPTLMNLTLGTKFRVVRGYSGSAAIDLAIERGEVQGQSDSFSSMAKRWPDWRQKVNVIVQISLTRHAALPDVPVILDYVKPPFVVGGFAVDEVETAWRVMLVQKAMGRPFVAGPGVPAERVKALRDAFTAMVRDAEFRAEAERGKNEIDAVDGGEIQRLLAQVSAAPKSVVDLLKTAITYKADEASSGGSQAKQ
jgi:tripartite-type tricarboxylate transporter receptor subunit TctC